MSRCAINKTATAKLRQTRKPVTLPQPHRRSVAYLVDRLNDIDGRFALRLIGNQQPPAGKLGRALKRASHKGGTWLMFGLLAERYETAT